MFRIRRIIDDIRPRDKEAMHQVQGILRDRFSLISREEIDSLPELMKDPLKNKLRYSLAVADDLAGRIKGFALGAYAPDLKFYYLDYLAADISMTGRGVGGALYQRVRQEALGLKAIGIFMECLPDDPALCGDKEMLKQNIARLRFYETFGARVIINTAYETPINPDYDCPPYLIFDGLGKNEPLTRQKAGKIVKAILKRKYGDVAPDDYIDMVVASFRDDPVQLRPVKKKPRGGHVHQFQASSHRIALVVNDRHEIHHIHERGYVGIPGQDKVHPPGNRQNAGL